MKKSKIQKIKELLATKRGVCRYFIFKGIGNPPEFLKEIPNGTATDIEIVVSSKKTVDMLEELKHSLQQQ